MSAALWGALVGAAFVASVAWPLATYTLTLACFGLAHVLSELRYVDHRFGARLGHRLRWSLAVLLGAVVAVRMARLAEVMPGSVAAVVELTIVVSLTAVVCPVLWRAGRWPTWAACAVVGALTLGVFVSPVHTLLLLAVLHNATPLGFLAEALRGRRRARALAWAGVAFVALPLWIATGGPTAALASLGWVAPNASVWPAGPLAAHLGVYLPAELQQASWALYAFSAFVFMQCMHYAVVIGVLPRLQLDDRAAPVMPWPSARAFGLAIVGLSALLAVHFWFDFGQARAIYGTAAAVHAWVELPLLLLALAPIAAADAITSPARTTAAPP